MICALLVSSCAKQESSSSSKTLSDEEMSSISTSMNTLISDLSTEEESGEESVLTSEEASTEETVSHQESTDEPTSEAESSEETFSYQESATEVTSEQVTSEEESLTSDSSVESLTSDSLTSDVITSDSEMTSKDDPMKYWAGLSKNQFGDAFRKTLKALINDTGSKTIGYSANNAVLAESDKALNGKAGIIPFYHPDYCATTGWNKEHVWPDSRGAGKSGPGADPQMLRPTANACNSARGNNFYGLNGSNEFDPARCSADTKNGDPYPLYEPARGEAARIIFYVAARYGTDTNMTLSNNPSDSADKHTMGTLKYLVQWNNQYPVTAQEIRRNNYLHEQGFARNPFIDNRDFVNYIWDENGYRKNAYDEGTLPGGSEWIPDSSEYTSHTHEETTSLEPIVIEGDYTFDSSANWPTSYPSSESIIADDYNIRFGYYYAATYNNFDSLQFKKGVDAYICNVDAFEPIDKLVVTMASGGNALTVYAGDAKNPSTEVKPNQDGSYSLNGARYLKLVNKASNAVYLKQFKLSFVDNI